MSCSAKTLANVSGFGGWSAGSAASARKNASILPAGTTVQSDLVIAVPVMRMPCGTPLGIFTKSPGRTGCVVSPMVTS